MNGKYFCNVRNVLLFCWALVAGLAEAEVKGQNTNTFYYRFSNNGTNTSGIVWQMDANNGEVVLNFNDNLAAGFSTTVRSSGSVNTAKVRYYWSADTTTYSDWVQLTSKSSGSPQVIQRSFVPEPEEWCIQIMFENRTANFMQARVVIGGIDSGASIILAPGVFGGIPAVFGPYTEKSDVLISWYVLPNSSSTYLDGTFSHQVTGADSASVLWYECGDTPGAIGTVEVTPTPVPNASTNTPPINYTNSPTATQTNSATEGTLKTGFDALAAYLDGIAKDQRAAADKAKSRGDAAQTSFDGINSKLSDIESNTDGLEAGQTLANGKLDDLISINRGSTNYLNAMRGDLAALGTNISNLGTNLAGMTNGAQRVAGSGDAVDGQSGTIGDYAGRGSGAGGDATNALGGYLDLGVSPGATLPAHDVELFNASWGEKFAWNFNPLADSDIAAIAPWIRNFILVPMVFGIFFFLLRETSNGIKAAGAFQQTKGVNIGVSVAGFGAQTSWFSAIAAAAVAIAALLAIGVYFSSWIGSQSAWLTILNGNRFTSTHEGIKLALYLANTFFPLTECISLAVLAFGYVAGFTFLLGTKSVIIRALPS